MEKDGRTLWNSNNLFSLEMMEGLHSFASFLGFTVGHKGLFSFTCLAMFSTKLVAILKRLICLLLSFCMESVPQTKALCHPLLAAKYNVFSLNSLFLISLTCSITSYSWIPEDILYIFKDWLSLIPPVFIIVFGEQHMCCIDAHRLDESGFHF